MKPSATLFQTELPTIMVPNFVGLLTEERIRNSVAENLRLFEIARLEVIIFPHSL